MQQHPDSTASDAVPVLDELALDGVRYADLPQAGRQWRLGATNPHWRQELLALPANPDGEALAALEERGLWLAPAASGGAPPLAVMCCGLGSVWPGMGRELYDNFPVARAAMDRIAAVADWDVLGLMDETDVEKISLTRWQIPYLFMLELAQWSVFTSLGLRPALLCGHSLGEVIGLCFSGICAPEVAWYLLDTRAVHMAEREAKATRETGMMAVHADAGVLREICAAWPALYVSNYNTPQQFILSGPRPVLQEVRKNLRKRRIPAIVLNVSLAFHHPSMRVLRDLALRRLNALEMSAPQVPLLSCVTTGFYSDDQAAVCRFITDLDENSVRWSECVQAMWERDGIRHFLELGPQDTLCSLVADNEARALCFSAGRKGREVEGLRQTCARLYALGHLRREAVVARVRAVADGSEAGAMALGPAPHCGLVPLEPLQSVAEPVADLAPASPAATVEHGGAAKPFSAAPDSLPVVLDVLSRASGRPVSALRPEMDLRYDLALRSSRFPLIIQEVEKILGIVVSFEDLLRVSTIGDLARVLGGQPAGSPEAPQDGASGADRVRARVCAAPLCRFVPQVREEGASARLPEALPLDPCAQGLPLRPGQVLALCVLDARLLPRLLRGLAPLGCVLAVPRARLECCAPLVRAGSRLVALDMPVEAASGAAEDVADFSGKMCTALRALAECEGRVDGLVFAPPPAGEGLPEEVLPDLLTSALRTVAGHGLRYACCCSLLPPEGEHAVFDSPLEKSLLALAGESGLPVRAIRLLDRMGLAGLDEWGDMLAREFVRGTAPRVLWARPDVLSDLLPPVLSEAPASAQKQGRAPALHGQSLLERPERFPLVFPDPQPACRATATLFQGACHFSRFADPALAEHGGQDGNALGLGLPWLPVSRGLKALLEGAQQLLPWLTVAGFSDLRFFRPPVMPPGVTRECRLTLVAEPWLIQDQVMTRMCRGALSARELTANCRHTDSYASVLEGMVLLAAHSGEMPPLWPDMTGPGLVGLAGATAARADVFYDAVGLGPRWRMLKDFAALPGAMFSALLQQPEASIAPKGDCDYTDPLLVMEGVVQAAWLAIAHEHCGAFSHAAAIAGSLARWSLAGVGFIRFWGQRAPGVWRLLLRRSWADGRLLRFDAQAADQYGQVFLTMHHLEFDLSSASAPQAETVERAPDAQ